MRNSNSHFKQKILKVLNAVPGISHARIMISVSGGPDSTALLHFLASVAAELNFRLFAFYLDHGIRSKEEIDQEIHFIENLCIKLNIELYCEHLTAGELKDTVSGQNLGMEMAAREKRYYFLEKYASAAHCDFIALGHTLDDNIETVLMRFFQGSGSAGLKGIPVKRGRIIRPLFFCTKNEVMQYLEENKLDYCIDSTNLQNNYLRNKIRNQLIPLVTEIFPGFRSSVLNLSQKMQYQEEFIKSEVKRRLKIEPYKAGFRVLWHDFTVLPSVLKISSIFRIYNKLTGNSGEKLPFRFIKCLIQNKTPGRISLNSYGLKVLKKDNYLFFDSDIVYNKKKGYLIVSENLKSSQLKNKSLFLTIINDGAEYDENTNYGNELVLKRDLIELPLIIRSKKNGDYINFVTFSKALKKIFNEWKVPEEKRAILPLVADRSGIIGIMGKAYGYKNIVVSKHNKLVKEDKIVRIIIN